MADTATSSAQAVGNTSELIARVVPDLPRQQIVSSRMVNSMWKDAIDHSPDVKRKLFVKADGGVVAPVAFATVGGQADAPMYDETVGKLNPVFDWKTPHDEDWTYDYGDTFPISTVASPVGDDDSADGPLHPSKQFITQPPCLTVAIRFCWKWAKGGFEATVPAYVRNPDGVTFGDVCDAANKALDTKLSGEYGDETGNVRTGSDTMATAVNDQESARRDRVAETKDSDLWSPKFHAEMVIATAMDWYLKSMLPSDEPAEYDANDPNDDPDMSSGDRKQIREGWKDMEREDKGIRLPQE